MVALEALSSVAVFTKDQRRASDFYTRRVGLRVRERLPKHGYLLLGATKGGKDAGLEVWQPDPERWGPEYAWMEEQIGEVTGFGFSTSNLPGTVELLRRRRVEVEPGEGEEGGMARFKDGDGNVLFLVEEPGGKVRRRGLRSLAFVTVACRDAARTGEFYTRVLGLRARRVPGEEFKAYRLTPGGTSIMPFTPRREMYRDPADYEADLAHIGEHTTIAFSTRDIYGVQDRLLRRGVRFKDKAEVREWGGIRASFYDPDENIYSIVQYPAGPRRG